MENDKALAAVNRNYSIEKMKDMTSMSTILKKHIVGHKLYTNISGKNYAHVEGWQFAGGLMGTYPRVVAVHNLSSAGEVKWQADVEIVEGKTGKVLSNGFAICSNKENKKKNFDEYAVLSMAQTRAIGKAYRNLIGWVMKLAGYEGTPSEEMKKVGEENTETTEPVQQSGVDYLAKLNAALEQHGATSDAKKKEFVMMKAGIPIKNWKEIKQNEAQMIIAVLAKKSAERK